MKRTRAGVCRACERDDVKFSPNRQVCTQCRSNGKRPVLPLWDKSEIQSIPDDELPSFGEAHIFVLESDWIVKDGRTASVPLPSHRPRMSRVEASKYYSDKINNAMGWNQKPAAQSIEESFVIKETAVDISVLEARCKVAFKKVRRATNVMIKNEVKNNLKLCSKIAS